MPDFVTALLVGPLNLAMAYFLGITFAIGGLGTLQDSIIVGESDNYGDVSSYEMSNGLYGIIPELPGKYRSIPKNWPPAADIPAGVENGPFYPIRGYEVIIFLAPRNFLVLRLTFCLVL